MHARASHVPTASFGTTKEVQTVLPCSILLMYAMWWADLCNLARQLRISYLYSLILQRRSYGHERYNYAVARSSSKECCACILVQNVCAGSFSRCRRRCVKHRKGRSLATSRRSYSPGSTFCMRDQYACKQAVTQPPRVVQALGLQAQATTANQERLLG